MATITLVTAIDVGWRAGRLLARWDRTIESLAAPELSPEDAASARDFAEDYPLFMVNRTARAMLLRPETPLASFRRNQLTLLDRNWPITNAEKLLSQLEAGADPPLPREIKLRRVLFNSCQRNWTAAAWSQTDAVPLAHLLSYLDDEVSATIWTFLSAWQDGRWDLAAVNGEEMLADRDFAAYHASIAGVLARIYTAGGQRTLARAAWERSFEEDPSNNDAALRGLGVVGP